VRDSAGDCSHGLRDLSAAGPDGLATATEAEAPALMFKKHTTSQPRFIKKRIATTTIAISTATSTTLASVMFSTSKRGPIMTRGLRPCHVHNFPRLNEARHKSAFEKHMFFGTQVAILSDW